jgi:hypothetical protein
MVSVHLQSSNQGDHKCGRCIKLYNLSLTSKRTAYTSTSLAQRLLGLLEVNQPVGEAGASFAR